MTRRTNMTVLALCLSLLCVSNLRAVSVEYSSLDEQVLFLEYALKHKAYSEIKEAIDGFHPQAFAIGQPMLSRYSDRLLAVGLALYQEGQTDSSFSLFEKIRMLDPGEWRAISFLNQYREDRKFIDIANTKNLFDQLRRLLNQFEPAVILITQINETLFWAVLLTLLAFTVWMLRHYFPLATHDMIQNEKGLVEKKRLAVWALLLLWPVLFGSGWLLLVIVLISSLWFYADKAERKTIVSLFVVLALMTLVSSVNQFLLHQTENPYFLQTKKIIKNHLLDYDRDAVEKNPHAKLFLAYNNFHSGQLEEGMDWLNSVDETLKHNLRKNLYGYAFLANKDYQKAINVLSEVLSSNSNDETALYNLTLALLERKDEKTYDAFLNRFPKISTFKERVAQAQLPSISDTYIWSLFISSGKKTKELTLFYVMKSSLKFLVRFPVLYFFIVFFLYIKTLPHLFHNIGKSTHCAKCQKAIKRENTSRAVNVCNDCYQLFLIKDALMADAKSYKEAEINRNTLKRNMFLLLLSFLSPGFFLHMRGQHRLFVIVNFFYFTFVIIAFSAWQPLAVYYGTVPIFAKTFGILAAIVFLVSNALIFQGDEYGV